MGKLMYSCEQAARLSSRAMEQPLGVWQRLLLNTHLVICRRCTNFRRQIAFLRRAAHQVPETLEKDGD